MNFRENGAKRSDILAPSFLGATRRGSPFLGLAFSVFGLHAFGLLPLLLLVLLLLLLLILQVFIFCRFFLFCCFFAAVAASGVLILLLVVNLVSNCCCFSCLQKSLIPFRQPQKSHLQNVQLVRGSTAQYPLCALDQIRVINFTVAERNADSMIMSFFCVSNLNSCRRIFVLFMCSLFDPLSATYISGHVISSAFFRSSPCMAPRW